MTDIPDTGELGGLSVLKEYGYSTAEEVFFLAQAIGPELAETVGLPSSEIMSRLIPMLNLPSAADLAAVANLETPLGVPLDGLPPQMPVTGPVSPATLNAVNLINQCSPIRSQGSRGTCVAHAALAVLEHYLTQSGTPSDLSEQFLYWNCKQNDGIPDRSGTWLKYAFPLIFRDGVCPESIWPYQNIGCITEGCGPPPAGAIIAALTYRTRVKPISANSTDDIRAELAAGRAVAFSVPVFRSWYQNLQVRLDGKINMPVQNDIPEGGHAMTFVGYETSNDPGIGGGRFILRNSWGTDWARASPYGAGYGSIPFAYIARYGMEAYTIAEV